MQLCKHYSVLVRNLLLSPYKELFVMFLKNITKITNKLIILRHQFKRILNIQLDNYLHAILYVYHMALWVFLHGLNYNVLYLM